MKPLFSLPFVLVFACGDNLAGHPTPDAHGVNTADAGPQPVRALAAEPPANFGPPPGILSVLDVDKLAMQQNVAGGVAGGGPGGGGRGGRGGGGGRADN